MKMHWKGFFTCIKNFFSPLFIFGSSVSQVLKEMESIQKREKDETEALEKMVQQVEANLETTTVSIEKLLSSLKN